MGVTLYYHGTLRKPQDVHDLVTELTDIATANHWKYHILDDPWDAPVDLRLEHEEGKASFIGNAGLKGIILVTHPECEGVHLLFDKDGVLRSLLTMTEPPAKRDSLGFTKTQFAGVDVHIELVHLLEHIGNKYMKDWHLEDDCGYIKHRDRERALAVFHTIDDAINAVTEAFETLEIPEDLKKENEEEFIAKVQERIKLYLPGAEITSIRDEEE
jgi:hypothetical protein